MDSEMVSFRASSPFGRETTIPDEAGIKGRPSVKSAGTLPLPCCSEW